MNDKNAACVCKCQNKCECSPEDGEACEEAMKIFEARRVSISKDVASIDNQPSKNEAQEKQCDTSCGKSESNPYAPPEAEAMNKETKNTKRLCNSADPTNSCKGKQEKEPNKSQELKSLRSSSIKALPKRHSSVNLLTPVSSEYSGDEWDRFGLFIAAECKSMSKENARNFKKKCLELILEYQ